MYARLLWLVLVFAVACARPVVRPPEPEPAPPAASADLIALEQVALARLEEVRAEGTPFVAPAIAGRVTDLAGKLAPAERRALEDELERFDRKTTNEIAVLVIPSLGGHSIEDVAFATANAWKLGKRGADNGVLLLVAVEDRRVRIETGRGVGAQLTDLQANDIIQSIKPALRAGDWFDALTRAVAAIEKALLTVNP